GQVRAAATLSAGPWRTLWRGELRQLLPPLPGAAACAIAGSLGEFPASLLLPRPELAALPVAIYDRLGRPGAANGGAALGLALVLMAVAALVMLGLQRRERGALSAPRGAGSAARSSPTAGAPARANGAADTFPCRS